MGEAKGRELSGFYPTQEPVGVDPMSIPREMQERVFNAVRRACAAWNTWPGHDCVLHAAAASAVLGRLGVQHSVTVGAAAFCFGHGPGDIVNHYTLPDYGWRIKGGFHAWISAGSGKDATLIDLTAYTLPDKACELAAIDGLPTTIAPDLPRWFWGRRRDLLYPDPDMDQSSPGQIWVSPADRNLILPEDAFDRCSGGGTGASAALRRQAVELFEQPEREPSAVNGDFWSLASDLTRIIRSHRSSPRTAIPRCRRV